MLSSRPAETARPNLLLGVLHPRRFDPADSSLTKVREMRRDNACPKALAAESGLPDPNLNPQAHPVRMAVDVAGRGRSITR